MNNSAEAESYLKNRKIKDEGLWETYSHENDPGYSGGGIRLSRLLSEFHQFAREKELSELTDEVIEEVIKAYKLERTHEMGIGTVKELLQELMEKHTNNIKTNE